MDYMGVANSALLYIGVFVILGIVVAFCALFYLKTRKRALELGVKKASLDKVVKSTILFTFVPSLAIAVGLFALVGVVGVPWATLRLSIIGSLNYELNSANIAVGTLGYASVADAIEAGSTIFGTIMFAMSLGIILPPIINALLTKPLANRLQTGGSSKKSFLPVMNACFMIALLSLYIPNYIFAGLPTVMVVLVSFILSVLLEKLASRPALGWMGEFAMPISLLAGMVSSILWTNLFA